MANKTEPIYQAQKMYDNNKFIGCVVTKRLGVSDYASVMIIQYNTYVYENENYFEAFAKTVIDKLNN